MTHEAERSMDWYSSEPTLTEMLADPIVHAIMESDGFDRGQVRKILLNASRATDLTLLGRRNSIERRGMTGDGGDDRQKDISESKRQR